MSLSIKRFRAVGASVAVALFAPLAVSAQASVAPTTWSASRQELTADLSRLDALAASSAYSARLRARARSDAAAARARLERGDFTVGDRIEILVDGSSPFSDTVTVSSGSDIQVGTFGRVELRGVLRSEISDKVRTLVATSVLDATVRVQPLLRVAVAGSVSTPGYVLVSPESRLDEVLTIGGGPAADADLQRMELVRGDEVVLTPPTIISAIAEGRTIAELGVQQGDMLRLRPRTPPWDRQTTLQVVAVVVAPLLTLIVVR